MDRHLGPASYRQWPTLGPDERLPGFPIWQTTGVPSPRPKTSSMPRRCGVSPSRLEAGLPAKNAAVYERHREILDRYHALSSTRSRRHVESSSGRQALTGRSLRRSCTSALRHSLQAARLRPALVAITQTTILDHGGASPPARPRASRGSPTGSRSLGASSCGRGRGPARHRVLQTDGERGECRWRLPRAPAVRSCPFRGDLTGLPRSTQWPRRGRRVRSCRNFSGSSAVARDLSVRACTMIGSSSSQRQRFRRRSTGSSR